MIVYLLAFVFPAAAFFGGAYLVFRGISKHAPTLKFTSGTARTDSPVERHLEGGEAVYSKVVVECFTGKAPEWKMVYSSERKAPFKLSGRPVSVEHADIRPSRPEIIQGMMQGGTGLISSMESLLEFTGSKVMLKPVLGRQGAFIDPGVLEALYKDQKLRKALERHRGDFIRISGYSIPQGAKLCVASGGNELRGSAEHPILITDEREEGARSAMDEKSRLSVLLGAGLVAFSFLLSSLLLSSL